MTRTAQKRRALVAGLLATSLAFSGFGALSVFAEDATTSTPGATTIATTDVSLTIHKYTPSTKETADAKTLANGTALTAGTDLPGSEPIGGIKFDIKEIKYDNKPIDLTTNAGWELVAKFKALFDKNKTATQWADSAGKNYTLGTATTVTTADDGTATFGKDQGALKRPYLVSEQAPTDMTKVKVNNKALTAKDSLFLSSPFVVTLPMTESSAAHARNAWIYNVHVYPKNEKTSLEKAVVDTTAPGSGVTAGSPVTYTITTKVPRVQDGFAEFVLIDSLPTSTLEHIDGGNTDTIELGTIADGNFTANANTQPKDQLIKGTDTQTQSATKDGKLYISVTFTETGLEKLKLAGDKVSTPQYVRWTLKARVKDTTTATTKEVSNQANLISVPSGNPTSGWNPNSPTTPVPGIVSNEVKSYYGGVTIKKTSTVDDTAALGGAKFAIYACDNQNNYINIEDGTVTNDNKEKARVSVDGVSEWTTASTTAGGNTKGEVTIDGLLANDYRNDSANKDENTTWASVSYYCLVETQAPEGYEIMPQPVKFQILKDSTAVVDLKIKDVPSNGGFDLPLTGANGIALMVAAGVLLIAGSGFYLVAMTRRNNKEEA